MDDARNSETAARERHQTLDLIGRRAHATAVGLIQLCEELLNAGVLGTDALDRIKDAICSELTVSKRARVAATQSRPVAPPPDRRGFSSGARKARPRHDRIAQ